MKEQVYVVLENGARQAIKADIDESRAWIDREVRQGIKNGIFEWTGDWSAEIAGVEFVRPYRWLDPEERGTYAIVPATLSYDYDPSMKVDNS